MAVKYTIIQHGNWGKPDAPKKYYAQVKAGGELTLRKLSKEIVDGSFYHGKRYGCIDCAKRDLTKILKRHLNNVEIVGLATANY